MKYLNFFNFQKTGSISRGEYTSKFACCKYNVFILVFTVSYLLGRTLCFACLVSKRGGEGRCQEGRGIKRVKERISLFEIIF